MKENLTQHFSPEERPFLSRVEDWLDQVRFKKRLYLTDFLDPRQSFILESFLHRERDVKGILWGGYPRAERCRGYLYPEFLRDEADLSSGVVVLEARLAKREATGLTHRDYLGSLLSLGVKRDKLGDLLPFDGGCQVIAALEIADYLHLMWHQVNRYAIRIETVSVERLQQIEPELEELQVTVPSLRLDAVLAEVLRLSRSDAAALIKAKKVQVNWRGCDEGSAAVKAGDVISVKGYGRLYLLAEMGENKKGRLRLKVGKLK